MTALPMNDPKTTAGTPEIGKRAERLQVMLAEEELTALDDWRFNARMPSRSAAVRELIRRGLAAEGYFTQATQNDQSSSFGIFDRKGLAGQTAPDRRDSDHSHRSRPAARSAGTGTKRRNPRAQIRFLPVTAHL